MSTMLVSDIKNALGTGAPGFSLGIAGNSTGATPATGTIGERLSISRLSSSTQGLTNNTVANVTSAGFLTITPGIWLMGGTVVFTTNTTTSVTYMQGGFSKTSATLPASTTSGVMSAGEYYTEWQTPASVNGGGNNTLVMPPDLNIVTTNTNYYLIAKAGFTVSTLSCWGELYAIRIA